jgi:hypothetical protein
MGGGGGVKLRKIARFFVLLKMMPPAALTKAVTAPVWLSGQLAAIQRSGGSSEGPQRTNERGGRGGRGGKGGQMGG